MWSIRPYVTGDPLVDTRMPEIVKIIRKYNQAPLVIYTNGSAYQNREVLTEFAEVHFTVSAATPETYEIMHGRPFYPQVVQTIEWLEKQPKRPKIILNFVITKLNLPSLIWKKQWARFEQVRVRVHGDNTHGHLDALALPESLQVDENLTAPNTGHLPCAFYNNCIVNAHGDVMLCCLGGPTFGNIRDTPLIDAWRARCATKMDHAVCRTCMFRSKDWKQKLEAA